MPDIVVSDKGEVFFLNRMIREPWLLTDELTLRLFVNDYTPTKGVTILDVTEATFPAYTPLVMDPTQWTAPVSLTGVATMFYGTVPLTFGPDSTSEQVYGWYVTAVVDGDETLLLAQRLDGAPVSIAFQPALILPMLRLHSEFEP